MAANHARRASDGRRQHARRYRENLEQCRILHFNGATALTLVAANPPKPKLVPKQTPVIPGLLSVGKRVAIFETAPLAVTFAGQPRLWSRERVNEVITVCREARGRKDGRSSARSSGTAMSRVVIGDTTVSIAETKIGSLPKKTAKAETPAVLMLPAQCPAAKQATEQGVAAAA